MRPIHLLIKPVSGMCNIRCKYCFYADETQKRTVANYGKMSEEVLSVLVKKTLAEASECAFMFQGGEPTLAGLPFYQYLVQLVKQENKRGIHVQYAIQTNGMGIDDQWAEFFSENQFLVGLSMDGIQSTHDRWRVDVQGQGTYVRVRHAAEILRHHGVDFNIVTVVTAQVAKRITTIYSEYRQLGFDYQQFIPCLDPLGEERGRSVHSLTPSLYARFLKTLFDCWYEDWKAGQFVYNRTFENYILMLRGYPPESCGMGGGCSRQLVVEADGSVFPCDFYVLDDYCIGNLCTDSFEQIERNRDRLGFIRKSYELPSQCQKCEWLRLCRGGCRRDREPFTASRVSFNYFCEAYKSFFSYAVPRLMEIKSKEF